MASQPTRAALPSYLLPPEAQLSRSPLRTSARRSGQDAVTARGQRLALPACNCNHLYLLAASDDHDRTALCSMWARCTFALNVQAWDGYIGQRDSAPLPRGVILWTRASMPRQSQPVVTGITPGLPSKPAAVAWFASHRHDATGADVPYAYAYLYCLCPTARVRAAQRSTLPDDAHIKLLAVTAARDAPDAEPAAPLYDTLERHATD